MPPPVDSSLPNGAMVRAAVTQPMISPQPPAPRFRPSTAGGREQQLREIIVAHESELKACVDRQLKLSSTLSAEGTLVIEVDPSGRVPQAGLKGASLAGTPLESCLRLVASRWRFPRSEHAYAIEAPLKISGTER